MSTGNWLFAFIPVMLAYSGWNASAYVAEEIRDPGRNLPRSLAIGTLAVIAVYFGINLLYLFVFSVTELAALQGQRARRRRRSAARLRRRSRDGHRLDRQPAGEQQRDDVCGAARLFRDGARRRVLRCGVEGASHLQDAGVLDRRADDLGLAADPDRQRQRAASPTPGSRSRCSSASRCSRCSSCAGASRTRARPFKALGYPIAPAIFTIACFVILANALYTDLVKPMMAGTPVGPSAWGFLVIGLGLPVYYFFARAADGYRSINDATMSLPRSSQCR